MTPHELKVALMDRDIEVARLRDDCKKLSASRNHYRKRSERLEQLVSSQGVLIDSMTEKLVLRPGKRNVSVYGGYTMALKRNLGHTSSSAIVQVVGGDSWSGGLKDKNIATRFEHRCCHAQRLLSEE
eukprot:9466696-Pyramimonas_sp.AAC.1